MLNVIYYSYEYMISRLRMTHSRMIAGYMCQVTPPICIYVYYNINSLIRIKNI